MEAIILTIHKEDFSAGGEGIPTKEEADSIASCSPYMKELQTFISRVSVDYLQDFVCGDFVASCVEPLCVRAIQRFVTHASIVRPLGRQGRARLAADCAQLESTLEPMLPRRYGGHLYIAKQARDEFVLFQQMELHRGALNGCCFPALLPRPSL